ncbi:hypothetical protein KFE96_09455 [Kordiimonas sp. SCSIO 12603]|uniref:hypothetical protein n=1 Tax=Kordiimonas sp. SCSIO 12603 TaxID=2829596 RepID=UPI0021025C8A|nr:hypothetical protein [Kordiimonas sp. SCSIO 12603]UTW57092.1 hypothetical protein KFE96_09455 [Kordiimonas sp. SCSIO 12603]
MHKAKLLFLSLAILFTGPGLAAATAKDQDCGLLEFSCDDEADLRFIGRAYSKIVSGRNENIRTLYQLYRPANTTEKDRGYIYRTWSEIDSNGRLFFHDRVVRFVVFNLKTYKNGTYITYDTIKNSKPSLKEEFITLDKSGAEAYFSIDSDIRLLEERKVKSQFGGRESRKMRLSFDTTTRLVTKHISKMIQQGKVK